MGGFDLHSLEIEQEIKALGIIVSTYKLSLPTSKLFKQSLEYAQLENEFRPIDIYNKLQKL